MKIFKNFGIIIILIFLFNLQHGGIAFLYHPCARQDLKEKLRAMAVSCLQRHVITPYERLSPCKVWTCQAKSLLYQTCSLTGQFSPLYSGENYSWFFGLFNSIPWVLIKELIPTIDFDISDSAEIKTSANVFCLIPRAKRSTKKCRQEWGQELNITLCSAINNSQRKLILFLVSMYEFHINTTYILSQRVQCKGLFTW